MNVEKLSAKTIGKQEDSFFHNLSLNN